eukprot:scaffold30992_cov59-Phaeocystis_antarctica.AAC.2
MPDARPYYRSFAACMRRESVPVKFECRCMLGVGVRCLVCFCRGQLSVALGQPIYLRGSRPQRAAAARPPHCSSSRVLPELVPLDIIGELRRTRRLFASRTAKMRSPAANSASINPAASPQSIPLGVVPSPSCPSRAATPAGVCAAEPPRASLAGPNAPSTTPCRSVVVLRGRPTEGGGPPRIAKTYRRFLAESECGGKVAAKSKDVVRWQQASQQQAKHEMEKQLAAVVNRVLARRDPNPLLAIGLELVVMESSTAPEMGEDAGQKAERIAEALRQCARAACALPAGGGQPVSPATPDSVAGASDESLQSRFTQGADGLLSFGGLATFFGGLQAKVGPPRPKVTVAMEMEHTAAKDSKIEFTTANYDVHTSSAKEYAFVATRPNSCLRVAGPSRSCCVDWPSLPLWTSAT